MADVICCEEKPSGAICIFASEDVNPCDAAKRQFHQELARAIT